MPQQAHENTKNSMNLFNLTVVNMYGTNDIQSLSDDEKLIKLTGNDKELVVMGLG